MTFGASNDSRLGQTEREIAIRAAGTTPGVFAAWAEAAVADADVVRRGDAGAGAGVVPSGHDGVGEICLPASA